MNLRKLGSVIWHGFGIALDAAAALQGAGVKLPLPGGKAGAALQVAIAIEQAAKAVREKHGAGQ